MKVDGHRRRRIISEKRMEMLMKEKMTFEQQILGRENLDATATTTEYLPQCYQQLLVCTQLLVGFGQISTLVHELVRRWLG